MTVVKSLPPSTLRLSLTLYDMQRRNDSRWLPHCPQMGSDVALEIIVHSKFAAVTNWPAEELSSLLFRQANLEPESFDE